MSGNCTPAQKHLCPLSFVLLLSLLTAGLTGCARKEVTLPAPDAYPAKLSAWNVVWREGDALRINPGSTIYELNTALFSDHALKLRTLYIPDGQAATYDATESFDFPVGTVITKTFFYDKASDGTSAESNLTRTSNWTGNAEDVNFADYRIMETRVLVRQKHGWDALPYVWDGNDASLAITGKVIPAKLDGKDFPYLVPSRNECGSCHVTNHTAKAVLPIGLKARHINRTAPGSDANQLELLASAGHLEGLPPMDQIAKNAAFHDTAAPVDARARAYLDANCGHCHNARGAADTSGLLLDASTTDQRHMGLCKPPIAAGRGTGGRTYGIVPGAPDESILLWRMETEDPATRMPEIGRSLVHEEGTELIRAWIGSMTGDCSRS